MNPYLTSKNQPRVKFEIGLLSWEKLDRLIDTGFSGGIALYESFQAKIIEKPLGFQEYELADGSLVIFAIYEIKVRYQNISKIVNLLFTKSKDTLVGIEFLEGFTFLLDLKKLKVSLK